MAEEGAASPPPWLATVGEDEGESAAARGDFGLPAELMAVLPDDPFAQLEVARKITSLALASRLGWLEAEAERLRAQLAEAEDLRERVEQLNAALAVATGCLRRAEEENVPLISFLPVEAAVLRAERYPILSTSRTTEPYQRLVAALAASQILRIIQGLRHGLAS
jgi:hypothetical protein